MIEGEDHRTNLDEPRGQVDEVENPIVEPAQQSMEVLLEDVRGQ
jgi:hypothetical protein